MNGKISSNNHFQELIPLSALAIFFFSKENELKQMLRSGLWDFFL
jgi:hypothetical protein